MKKRILLLGALVGAFLLASCSGGNKKQVASSATPEELDDASKDKLLSYITHCFEACS